MLTDLYSEYLYLIGKLKDTYKLHIDVDHKDIHTFYKDKRPLFKLFYGMFTEENDPSIVVSFHLDLFHPEAIQWFINIYQIHPLIKMHDSYYEDSAGETYLGEDALIIKETFQTQDILAEWFENNDEEDTKNFIEAKVMGRQRIPYKPFDSQKQRQEAIIEFKRVKEPDDDESFH